MFKKSMFVAAALTAFVSSAMAAPAATTEVLKAGSAKVAAAPAEAAKALDPATIPAALKSPQFAGSMQVVKSFPGPSGLTGWVVKENTSNRQVILFSTADNNTVMAGILMDKDGNNLSAAYGEQHIPKPDFTKVLNEINTTAATVVDGSAKAKGEITVFYDVNCGFCKLMTRILAPAVEAGELRVRYVPVAILGADSAPKAAAVLGSKDISKTIAGAAAGTADKSDDKGLLAKVAVNTDLMKKHGFSGTPAVLYKVKSGSDEKTVVSNGLPTMSELFSNLGIDPKHLDKAKADPQLQRYVR